MSPAPKRPTSTGPTSTGPTSTGPTSTGAGPRTTFLQRHGIGRVKIGIVTAVAVLASIPAVVGATAQPGDGDIELTARFVDAGAIIPGNDVKVDGVKVGSVRDIDIDEGVAVLTFGIDDAATPVFEDATATVRPVSLLGERFVDVDRGDPHLPVLTDGAVIPESQTGRSVDLDELLTSVDDPTGTALAALVITLGEGSAARGDDLAAALEVLAPALTQSDQLVALLDDQNALLTSLIDNMAPVAEALGADSGAAIDALIENTGALLDDTAARAPELEATIAALPGTVEAARAALREVADLAGVATPALAEIRPLTGNLRSVSSELQAFADAANPALASLDPVLARGTNLLQSARPVVAELRAAGPDTRAVANDLRPIAESLLGDLDDVLNFIRNWALVTNGSDGISHYFRAHLIADAETATGLLPVPVDVPDLPLGGASASAAGPLAPVTDAVGSATERVTEAVDGAVGGLLGSPSNGSATGLSQEQERGLLESLLGGGR